jgi:hypothetical protein
LGKNLYDADASSSPKLGTPIRIRRASKVLLIMATLVIAAFGYEITYSNLFWDWTTLAALVFRVVPTLFLSI